MLQLIRGTVGTWIVKILFGLLIVSFAIWGIGDIFRGRGPASTVAEIGPVKISGGELDQEFRKQVDRLRPMFGGQLDMDQAKQLGLVDQTLEQMVERSLLDLAARDAGLLVGDELVRLRLQQIPGFRNAEGQFDTELFRRTLAARSMTEGTLINLIRDEASRQLVVGAIGASATPPEPLVDALYRFRNERRSAETLTLANDKMANPPAPDEAELTRYHEDKSVRFTAPEYRGLTVGLITVDDFAKTIKVTDEDLKAAYEEQADKFQLPERRSFEQVLVETEDKARTIADKARAGNELAVVAKAEGAEVSSLGPLVEAEVPEIGASVFDLQPGTIPEPIKSDLGWHVVKVTKIEPAQVSKLAEVRDQLRVQVQKDRATDQMPHLINKIEDALAGGATLEETAAKYPLTLARIEAVDASGLKPDGNKLGDTPAHVAALVPNLTQALQTAFNLAQGARSQVVDGADNSSFVVRVDSITPARLKPLTEVHDQVLAGWMAERRAEAAAKQAEAIVAQLKAGGTIETVAKATGAVAGTVGPLARTADARGDNKLPPDLLKQLFTLAPGGVAAAATADGQVVVRLTAIVPAEPAAAVGATGELRDSERRAISGDLLAQFTAGLRSSYPVSINRERIQQMFSTN